MMFKWPLLVLFLAGDVVNAQPNDWEFDYIDSGNRFSNMTDRSLRVNANGSPHIAYGEGHLYYAWFEGATWRHETVEPSPSVGMFASLALGSSGFPDISYCDEMNEDLKYVYQDGAGWHVHAVDSQGSVDNTDQHWICGGCNYPFFPPGSAPGYDCRVAIAPEGTTSWSSQDGLGDPESNWTYLVLAVDEAETELTRSNRVGEYDFEAAIP